MAVLDPTYLKRLDDFTMFQAWKNTTDTQGKSLNYVLYQKKRYPLSEALCFVMYRRKFYAVLSVDPVTAAGSEKPLKKIGEVFLNRKDEKDLTDTPEQNTGKAFGIYQRGFSRNYLVETPEREGVLFPMLEVRAGIVG